MHPPIDHMPLLSPSEADASFNRLLDECGWHQYELSLYGRQVTEPRLIDWAGAVTYRYSGRTLEPRPESETICELRQRVEAETGQRFNHVLINQYRNGQDYMGWHRDNEPELGPTPVIASLSLGQARPFQLRPVGGGDTVEVLLNSGDLLVMQSGCQASWQHQLPKRATSRIPGTRINLTFRWITQ